jgi:hypothetical protein
VDPPQVQSPEQPGTVISPSLQVERLLVPSLFWAYSEYPMQQAR